MLKLHVIPALARAADLTNGQSLSTLLDGQGLTVAISNGAVSFTSAGGTIATVITPDVEVAPGVVAHVINAVSGTGIILQLFFFPLPAA